ncbi:MAG: hypothetical protein Tsb0034_15370 [Ekhidna sp.]
MNRTIALAKEGKINENASIKDQHSIVINAPIDKVWDILIDLQNWKEWNSDVKKMDVEGPIKAGTKFNWTIGRLKAQSQIQLIDKPQTLAWTEKSSWVKRIYVWSLEQDENQTLVTLSSSLQGVFTVLVERHSKVYDELLNWLESLKKKSEEE